MRSWARCNEKRMVIISTLLNSTELLTRRDNWPSSHSNQHLDITYQPWNHGYFVVSSLQSIHHCTNQNEPPSGKDRNAIQYVSPNCHYNLSQSNGTPKAILISPEEKVPNKIWKKLIRIEIFVFEIAKAKRTNDDLWPKLYGIYLLIISNERNFYELVVV